MTLLTQDVQNTGEGVVVPTSNILPKLCEEQQNLVDLILCGRNVFFTGSAGCGKSTVLEAVVKELKAKHKRVDVIAPTGRSALQVHGMSTWSYMGWTPDFHKYSLERLKSEGFRTYVAARLRRTEVLIIDEISMVENHHLQRINICMKEVRCWNSDLKGPPSDAPAFGGVQVVVTGDFCQLPPVRPFQFCLNCGLETTLDSDGLKYNCPENHGPFRDEDKWAFQSAAWEEARFTCVNLQEIHRQRDAYFIRMLQKCRFGIPFTTDEITTLMNHPHKVDKATKLLCTRREVAKINSNSFRKLKTPVYMYKALDGFECGQEQHLQFDRYTTRDADGYLLACKDHRLEQSVLLRGGMLVILQVNLDIEGGLVNGSQGVICGFEEFDLTKFLGGKHNRDKKPSFNLFSGEHVALKRRQVTEFMKVQQKATPGRMGPIAKTFWPRVLFHNGMKCTIYAACLVNAIGDKEPYSFLHRTQIPLIPGWAMSVHKSQGMTLDRVIIDLSKAFVAGQVYVALSRATGLEGLRIDGDREALTASFEGDRSVQDFLQNKFGVYPWCNYY
ncbi:ATP-dependent DNA helicase PIF1 [Fusarium oxysporum f. sp. raphani]|uniref:ATP-dependent DNA helicase n=1 Tax=Fusarium oxysporum f. sp. raphani TaxID=96318 RepID=A0A8J5NPR9_FUSOX|nr:ATP-dependent DNA helicase PIF1 [Fusarium oxysporum f. sp. raphani]